MQPYLFPYIGYFQLINYVDNFVFYDDVNFINRGFINRNKILVNKTPFLFTLPLSKSSQFLKIKDILLDNERKEKWKVKFLKTIFQSYKKAPFFEPVYQLIESIIEYESPFLNKYTGNSLIKVSEYLDIKTNFEYSSEEYNESINLDRADRLIYISKKNQSTDYINSIGGEKIYSKEYFLNNQINLHFLDSKKIIYKQFTSEDDFVENLSIIDVLMFNSKKEVASLLNRFALR